MAKLSLGQKADRVLRFLLGLRNPHIVAQLRPYGFTAAEHEEGWALLRALGKGRLDAEPAEAAYDAAVLQKLNEWENKWFAITAATLARHAPDVHRWFFKNLVQTEGAAVIMSTSTFLERWALLDKTEAQGGPPSGGKAAKKKLGERGLRDVVLDEARRHLDQLRSIDAPLPDTGAAEQTQAELEKAEAAMWGWYLEWSRVARSTIRRRTHLKQLGFLRGGASGGDADEDGGADEDEPATDDLEPERPKNPAKPG